MVSHIPDDDQVVVTHASNESVYAEGDGEFQDVLHER